MMFFVNKMLVYKIKLGLYLIFLVKVFDYLCIEFYLLIVIFLVCF